MRKWLRAIVTWNTLRTCGNSTDHGMQSEPEQLIQRVSAALCIYFLQKACVLSEQEDTVREMSRRQPVEVALNGLHNYVRCSIQEKGNKSAMFRTARKISLMLKKTKNIILVVCTITRAQTHLVSKIHVVSRNCKIILMLTGGVTYSAASNTKRPIFMRINTIPMPLS